VQDIKSIRVFLKVAELKSFAAAARNLGMTPASVTRIVARLENDLDTQLLKRTTRQVALTSAGARVAARFAPLVEQFDQAAVEIARAARPDHGRLAINAPMSLGLRLLPGLIDSFRLAYPNVTLNVQLTDRLVDIVEETCDLAIRISGPPTDKSTIWRKICEVPRHAIAAPGLFDRIDRPQTPDDLRREYCMSYSANGGAEVWRFRKGQLTRNIPAGTGLISNSGDFLYSLVRSGGGIAVLPDFIFKDALARKEVELLLDDWEIQPLWLTLFYPPYETLPPLVASFSDFFEAYLRDVGGLEF
jgi:DNA-binding transcriptional LysR family regulator